MDFVNELKTAFKCSKKKLRRAALICAVVLFFSIQSFAESVTPSQSASPHLSFSHILPDQIAALGYNTDIAQDFQGYLWFAGTDGLARYDAYSINLFKHSDLSPNSLSNNFVNALEVGRDGSLWVATRSGLNLFDARTSGFKKFPQHKEIYEKTIHELHEDRQGFLWLSTDAGLFRFNPQLDQLTQFGKELFSRIDLNPEVGKIHKPNVVWSISEDAQGHLWLGTESLGAVRFDQASGEFKSYVDEPNAADPRGFNDLRKIYVDSENRVWAGTYDSGLHLLDEKSQKFLHVYHSLSEKSFTVWSIIEDKEGKIWVGDGSAVYFKSKNSNTFFAYTNDESNPSSPGNFVVRTVFEDQTGDIWLGFFPSGIDVIDRQASVFSNFGNSSNNPNTITGGGVTSALELPNGNLWVGTGYGLNYVDRKTGLVKRYQHDNNNSHSMAASTILSLALADDAGIWIGIWAGGLSYFDFTTGEFTNYLPDAQNPKAIRGKEVWSVIKDHKHQLWLATELGLNRFNPTTQEFDYFCPPPALLNGENVMYSRVVLEDSKNQLWVGSIHGLFKFDPQKKIFTRYQHDGKNSRSLSGDFVISLFEDSKKRLWVGTDGAGLNLFDPTHQDFKSYSTRDGLPDDLIGSITEDKEGNLWLGTQKGISKFNPDAEQFRNYDKHHGLGENFFGRRTGIALKTGELFFGHTKGYNLFRPEDLVLNTRAPTTVITDFKIANKSVSPLDKDSPLQFPIEISSSLQLSPKDSVFSFEFAALNFRHPEDNQYAYRLKGFETEWNYVGNKRSATYTNMSPGHYVFEVKSANNDGVWSNDSASIEIEILPPWWRTYLAYCVYLFILFALIYWFVQVQKMKLTFQTEKLEQERVLVKRLTQIDKLKDEFLANTSHELRTPLNGIIGLAESLRDGVAGEVSLKMRHHLSLIVDSGKRLANLVNDILDFSQLKNKGLNLNKKNLDLHVLAEVVLTLSKPLAEKKSVIFVNNIPKDIPAVFADEDRVLQILHNLVGNAVKFTDRGVISVGANVTDEFVQVDVADTGIGIPADRLDDIFESFTQVEGGVSRSQGGAGLGLSVTKQLVELHGGHVRVESVFGVGSTFSFSLPMSFGFADDEAPALKETPSRFSIAEKKYLAELDDLANSVNQENQRILIVDDDSINRKVVANFLSMKGYQIIEAESAGEAIEIVEQRRDIDLVLLDIMMPRVSGYEACRILRKLHPAHELPIILLTARSQMNDLVLGFEAGANDFLVKPVAKEALLARVATHLQLHDVMRNLDQKVAERTHELHQTNQELIHAQRALELANRKLEEASLSDPLTGLHNRRFLNKSILSDVALVDRAYGDWLEALNNPATGQPPPEEQDLMFILLDIDFFKTVNDTYGHTAGDRVLEQLSFLLHDALRESDYLIRWGGEEFLIVVRFCNRDSVPELVERIRQMVAGFLFDLGGRRTIFKTCSMGMAAYPFYRSSPKALTWEQVVDTADRALYLAKNKGRDCWVWIESNESTANPINPAINHDMNELIEKKSIHIRSSKIDV